jgi:hypothetical protein
MYNINTRQTFFIPTSYDETLKVKVKEENTLLIKEMTDKETGVKILDRVYKFKKHEQCFIASELIDWIIMYYKNKEDKNITRNEALKLCTKLQEEKVFAHVSGKTK